MGRGLYWLELHGEKLATDNKKVPPELAELIFEVQETLAELRTCAGGDAQREQLAGAGREAKEALDVSLREAFVALEDNFAKWDSAVSASPELIVQLKTILSRIAYLKTLVRDVDRELDVARLALILNTFNLNRVIVLSTIDLNRIKKMPLIFGIDLGTTNSLIAVMEEGHPRVIADPETGAALLPSVVALLPGGRVEVGKKAIELEPHLNVERDGRTSPAGLDGDESGAVVRSIKRYMGLGGDEIAIR